MQIIYPFGGYKNSRNRTGPRVLVHILELHFYGYRRGKKKISKIPKMREIWSQRKDEKSFPKVKSGLCLATAIAQTFPPSAQRQSPHSPPVHHANASLRLISCSKIFQRTRHNRSVLFFKRAESHLDGYERLSHVSFKHYHLKLKLLMKPHGKNCCLHSPRSLIILIHGY